ncbi:hypothetical protein [Enterococcus olivae]
MINNEYYFTGYQQLSSLQTIIDEFFLEVPVSTLNCDHVHEIIMEKTQ